MRRSQAIAERLPGPRTAPSRPLPLVVERLLAVPITIPCLGALVVFTWWAASEGGYPVTVWYPGGLLLLGMLAAAVAGLRGRVARIPAPVRLAIVLFAGYTAWSYLSILWADANADAWDGANRTFVYLVILVLFAAWRQRGDTAAALLGVWVLAVAGVALVTLLRLPSAANPLTFFISRRLAEPAGYPNATAATYLMAVWPALVLAGRVELRWWLRGLFAAAVVVMVDVALLSQSRGALISLPIVLILYFLLVPDRARSLAVLAAAAPAIALTVPGVLDVANRLGAGETPTAVMSDVATPILLAALGTGACVALWGAFETYRPPSPERAAALTRAVNLAGVVAAVGVVVTALALTGSPISTAGDAWRSFKKTYPPPDPTSTRLTRGLGSNRYDFYRVALNRFAAHPVEGIGADNFAQDYLVRRRSYETPRYPHSLELRTLAQTGIVGALLLFGALAAALVAARRATRRAGGFDAAVAAGATMAFIYWLVHGSADWFWEFPGLAGPAFAMLGLACALHPRRLGDAAVPGRMLRGPVPVLAAWLLALIGICNLLAPWGAERDVLSAARSWSADRAQAFRTLDNAARLNPLSDRPYLIAGSIALRLGDNRRASKEFDAALRRNDRDAYAVLELGAIASEQGNAGRARTLLGRAAALNPSDPVTRGAQARARAGRRVDVDELNRQIEDRARRLVRR